MDIPGHSMKLDISLRCCDTGGTRVGGCRDGSLVVSYCVCVCVCVCQRTFQEKTIKYFYLFDF